MLAVAGQWDQRGSYGLPVRDRRRGTTALLTAAHVAGELARLTEPGAPIEVHGYGYSFDDPADPVALGFVTRSLPLLTARKSAHDAALIEAVEPIALGSIVGNRPVSGLRDITAPDEEDQIEVRMRGARSTLRVGLLDNSSRDRNVRLPDGRYMFYEGVRFVRADGGFAAHGDSGSVLVDRSDRAVALLVGVQRSSGTGVCLPLAPTLRAMDCELV